MALERDTSVSAAVHHGSRRSTSSHDGCLRRGVSGHIGTLGEYGASLPDFDLAIYKLNDEARLTLDTARRIAIEISDWRKRGTDPKEFILAESARQQAGSQAAAESAERAETVASIDKLSVGNMFEAWLLDGASQGWQRRAAPVLRRRRAPGDRRHPHQGSDRA